MPAFLQDAWMLVFLVSLIVLGGVFFYAGRRRGAAGARPYALVARDTVIENMSDALLVLNEQNQLVDLNPAARALFFAGQQPPLGQPIQHIFAHWPELLALLSQPSPARGELLHPLNGSQATLEASVQPVRDPQGQTRGHVLQFHDITARKQVELALQQRTQQLENANKDLEAFSYSISHDLRAPLRAIRGFAQILDEDLRDVLNEEAQGDLSHILSASARMSQMIDALLRYSRLGRSGLVQEPVPLGRVLAQAREDLADQIAQSGAVLHLPADPPAVSGDPTLLGQIFTNLIGNAMLYQHPGTQPQVRVEVQAEGQSVVVRVVDNGIGIAPQDFERVFNVFQRLNREEDYPGTGIGLPLAKKATALLGGEIWVESEQGQGSTFAVRLPMA